MIYPLSLPAVRGPAQIALRANNVVAASRSPFTGVETVVRHPGQWWEASVTLPQMPRAEAERWVAFLLSLRGRFGTFLMGDPAGLSPRGTATAATITGTGDSVTVAMTGSLLAGDYIQMGTGATATLHKVLVDQTGNGTLEIWPGLRRTATAEVATLTNAKGRFRLSDNVTDWNINAAIHYGIAFDAVEAI